MLIFNYENSWYVVLRWYIILLLTTSLKKLLKKLLTEVESDDKIKKSLGCDKIMVFENWTEYS